MRRPRRSCWRRPREKSVPTENPRRKARRPPRRRDPLRPPQHHIPLRLRPQHRVPRLHRRPRPRPRALRRRLPPFSARLRLRRNTRLRLPRLRPRVQRRRLRLHHLRLRVRHRRLRPPRHRPLIRRRPLRRRPRQRRRHPLRRSSRRHLRLRPLLARSRHLRRFSKPRLRRPRLRHLPLPLAGVRRLRRRRVPRANANGLPVRVGQPVRKDVPARDALVGHLPAPRQALLREQCLQLAHLRLRAHPRHLLPCPPGRIPRRLPVVCRTHPRRCGRHSSVHLRSPRRFPSRRRQPSR
jgi:hypothetical protein